MLVKIIIFCNENVRSYGKQAGFSLPALSLHLSFCAVFKLAQFCLHHTYSTLTLEIMYTLSEWICFFLLKPASFSIGHKDD